MDLGIPMYPGRLVCNAICRLHDATLQQTRLELAAGGEYARTARLLRQFIYQGASPGQLASISFGDFDGSLAESFFGSYSPPSSNPQGLSDSMRSNMILKIAMMGIARNMPERPHINSPTTIPR